MNDYAIIHTYNDVITTTLSLLLLPVTPRRTHQNWRIAAYTMGLNDYYAKHRLKKQYYEEKGIKINRQLYLDQVKHFVTVNCGILVFFVVIFKVIKWNLYHVTDHGDKY